MTNQDFYTTLTIGTDLIPSEDIYYKKLGAFYMKCVLNKV